MQNFCEHDRSLKLEFYHLVYCGSELNALNTVRLFQNHVHISDIVKCDGHTLVKFVISDSSKISVLYTFSHKEPTVADHKLRQEAITHLCGGTTQLPYRLGRFLRLPHLPCAWFTNDSTSTLFYTCQSSPTASYDVYILQEGYRTTRYGTQYTWSRRFTGTLPGTNYGRVSRASATMAILHSRLPIPVAPVLPNSFL
jgi:hypothetical protein